MQNRLQNILTAKVDPIFFAFSCLLLILVSMTAQTLVQDIMKTSDDTAVMFQLARFKH
jgi:hypothetical protein